MNTGVTVERVADDIARAMGGYGSNVYADILRQLIDTKENPSMIEAQPAPRKEIAEKVWPKGYISVTGYVNRAMRRRRPERVKCPRCHLTMQGKANRRCQCKAG